MQNQSWLKYLLYDLDNRVFPESVMDHMLNQCTTEY